MAETADVHDLNSLLDVLQAKIDDEKAKSGDDQLTLREVLEVIGRRAYGPLLLIIGLISISPATLIPGSTWAFALLTLLISVQLLFHSATPWLPKSALDMQLSEEKLAGFVKKARPTARVIDKIVKPRWQFLAKSPWVYGIALLCVVAALITFPLGLIPIAPLIPGLAITFFGLGITARDGILLALGTSVMSGALWVLITQVF